MASAYEHDEQRQFPPNVLGTCTLRIRPIAPGQRRGNCFIIYVYV